MTTFVTVQVGDPRYPARFVRRGADGSVLEETLIPAGPAVALALPIDQSLLITEEYHPEGYPPHSD